MELMPSISIVNMGVEQNIAFVQSQLDLYNAASAKSRSALDEMKIRYGSASNELNEKQQEIRTLRQALIQPSASLSRSAIEDEVRLELRLGRLQSIREAVDGSFDELGEIAARWVSLQNELKSLAGKDLSDDDEAKISLLQSKLRSLLSLFSFRSFPVHEIILSTDNLRPLAQTRNRDGDLVEQELGFEMSASDAIRMKWAYYMALQEISNTKSTNHPKLSIFDEPGQQEIELPSLTSLLRWTEDNLKGQQFIAATSEPLATIYAAIGKDSGNVQSFDGFILKPLTG